MSRVVRDFDLRHTTMGPDYDNVWPIQCPDEQPDCIIKSCNPMTQKWQCHCSTPKPAPAAYPSGVCGPNDRWEYTSTGQAPGDLTASLMPPPSAIHVAIRDGKYPALCRARDH